MYKHLMGKYERILTIDGDYVHIVSSGKTFFDRDMGKTVRLQLQLTKDDTSSYLCFIL